MRAIISAAVSVLCLACARPYAAGSDLLLAETVPVVRVAVLQDLGGLSPKERDGRPLNESVSSGLAVFLSERAGGRFSVVDARRTSAYAGSGVFTLEGEISHVVTGPEDAGPYQLALRLYEETRPRRLRAQWAGCATSFLGLTSNLRNDPRVPADGLMGMACSRIAHALAAASLATGAAQRARLLALASGTQTRLQARLLVNGVLSSLAVSGAELSVRISGQPNDAVYVIASSQKTDPTPLHLPAPEKATQIAASRTLKLPITGSWRAAQAAVEEPRDLIVLAHRAPVAIRKLATDDQFATSSDADAPVRLFEAGNALTARGSGDPRIAALLERIAADPPGSWSAIRLTYTLAPAALPNVLQPLLPAPWPFGIDLPGLPKRRQ